MRNIQDWCVRCNRELLHCTCPLTPTADVNDRQVGGAHYKSKYQHWDFVVDTHQSYHQGSATAYVSRWRRKNGVEDLEKAMHYIEKCELIGAQKIPFQVADVFSFAYENDLTAVEVAAVWAICAHDWEAARTWVRLLIASAGRAATERLQPM